MNFGNLFVGDGVLDVP